MMMIMIRKSNIRSNPNIRSNLLANFKVQLSFGIPGNLFQSQPLITKLPGAGSSTFNKMA